MELSKTSPDGAILTVTETLGITQTELARLLGTRKQHLTDIKSGRKSLSENMLGQMRALLDGAAPKLPNLDSDDDPDDDPPPASPALSNLDSQIDLDSNTYQCMPDMQPDEFDRLVESIREKGLLTPIVVDEGGKVLDGHHRVKAAREAGIDDIPHVMRSGLAEAEKLTYAAVVNIERRHLSAEQKRDLVARLLEADPAQSDRQVAKATGTSPTTVGKVREQVGANTTSRTGRDGRTLQTANIGTQPKPAPAERPAQKIRHLNLAVTNALAALRDYDDHMTQTLAFELCARLRDTLIHYRPRLRRKDWDAMIDKLCQETSDAS